MNIGIIGTGKVASGLAQRWTSRGHVVFFGSCDPDRAIVLGHALGVMASGGTIAQAAKFGSIVLLAVGWDAVPTTLQLVGSLRGRILIDCTNPVHSDWTQGIARLTASGAERIAELVPDAAVVKAFNHICAHLCSDAAANETQPIGVRYCGDDDRAKAKVASLIIDAGYEPVDAGALKNARCLEPLGEQMLQFTHIISAGTNHAFRIVRG